MLSCPEHISGLIQDCFSFSWQNIFNVQFARINLFMLDSMKQSNFLSIAGANSSIAFPLRLLRQ
jgi:hypothetical protein